VYVRGTGVRLPARLAVSEAVSRGDCPPSLPERTGFISVAVSDGESAAEMAVHAARSALRRAGSGAGDVDLILHADTYYQGHDTWAVASYIQRETLGNQCPAVEIRQMSNGGMAAPPGDQVTSAVERLEQLLRAAVADGALPPAISDQMDGLMAELRL
jgi:3-oxoacyl-[acyl-carrier-protein] synthase-3